MAPGGRRPRVPEVQVEGRVGPDEASSFREGDPGLAQEDEPLVLAQDAEGVDLRHRR
jgi:hypothetical protein